MVTEGLLPWYTVNKRDLPWRQSREPYAVWVSEIMLQQTRVEAVIPYYRRFMQALPDVRALADAPEEQLLKLWEGLATIPVCAICRQRPGRSWKGAAFLKRRRS